MIGNRKLGSLGSIKSIQSGICSFTSSDNSKNVTISNVDLTKAIVIISNAGLAGSLQGDKFRSELTSSTNLLITHAYNASNAYNVTWQVIEFNNVKSLQYGTTTVNTTPQTVTITSVNTSKTIILKNFTTIATTQVGHANIQMTLTNSTTITFNSYDAVSYNYIVSWFVIEFN